MDARDARKIIAAYLVGDPVPGADLALALKFSRSDAAFAQHIRREQGDHCEWITTCDVFESRLDEFAEAGPEEQARRFPSLMRHYRECPACYDAYWQVMPIWAEDRKDPPSPTTRRRERSLSGSIVMSIGPGGAVTHDGIGIPPQTRTELYRAAGATTPDGASRDTDRRQWVLDDADAGIVVRLQVSGTAEGEGTIEIFVSAEPDSPVKPERMQLRVIDRATGALHQAASLSTFQREPLILPPGAWTLRLESETPGELYSWEVSLILERRADG